MTDLAPTETTNLSRYGDAELEWSRARDALACVPSPDVTYFLGTCRPDTTPHAAGIGAQWLDGDLYFTSSPAARKARDLAVNPLCTISVRLPGIDLVLDGTDRRSTRLNSSHVEISYAVFCLKKKKLLFFNGLPSEETTNCSNASYRLG